jgi:hypothetical protein
MNIALYAHLAVKYRSFSKKELAVSSCSLRLGYLVGGIHLMKRLLISIVLGLACCAAAFGRCTSNPLTVNLVANGTTTDGTVTVTNDITNLYITVATTGTTTIDQLEAAVSLTLAGIPQTQNQAPIVADFPYHETFSPAVTTYTFTIPLGVAVPGTSLYIALHGIVTTPSTQSGYGHGDDNNDNQQDAWGAGQLFPGSKACTQSGSGNGGGYGGNGGGGYGGNGGDGHGNGGWNAGNAISSMPHGGLSQISDYGNGGGNGRGDDGHGGNGGNGGGNDGNGGGCGGNGGNGGNGGTGDNGGCGASYFVYTVNCATVLE